MPRASRHYIPGYIWHITHRCHKKEFLLKFGRDRRRWMQWLFESKKRYSLIDYQTLISFLQMKDFEELQESCKNRIEQALQSREKAREPKWSESIAVGNKAFVESTMKKLRFRALGRKVIQNGEGFEIREQRVPYGANFSPENVRLRQKNTYYLGEVY